MDGSQRYVEQKKPDTKKVPTVWFIWNSRTGKLIYDDRSLNSALLGVKGGFINGHKGIFWGDTNVP